MRVKEWNILHIFKTYHYHMRMIESCFGRRFHDLKYLEVGVYINIP